MAGIYLHIPFCRQACHYCNFHFATSLRYKDDIVHAMVAEAIAEKDYLQDQQVDTIYFGGGTPSLLSSHDLDLLLNTLHRHYTINTGAEITLEANPDDIAIEKLKDWKLLGINRLSMGVQTFFDEELRWMNRAHNARQALASLELATASFNNITMDLIYGSPLLTDGMWEENVNRALAAGIPHLSCYALTVEEKTPLHKKILHKAAADVDPEKQARQFLLLMQWLREKGYEHYEVSNFALPGFRSRHNSSYWQGITYLGLGPSAHSFNGSQRRWNIANNQVYIKGIKEELPAREKEDLTAQQKLNEYIMISLRTAEGLNVEKVELLGGAGERRRIMEAVQSYLTGGKMVQDGAQFRLTDEGMLQADGIASDLFQTSGV